MDERLKFVARLLDGEKMAVLCREFDISRISWTMFGVPAVDGVLRACRRASAISASSETASTRPRPNSGVVIRVALTFALRGTTSGTNVKELLRPVAASSVRNLMPCRWRPCVTSEPTSAALMPRRRTRAARLATSASCRRRRIPVRSSRVRS